MKKFRYLYQNPESLVLLTKENMYEGERILYKADDMKYEDEKLNKKYECQLNITSYRVVIFDKTIIFDIPLQYIKPMLYGSSYIFLEFTKSPLESIPLYIRENLKPEDLSGTYELPAWTMIKYRTSYYNIDEGYNILLHALKAQEWNTSHVSKSLISNMNNMNYNNLTNNNISKSMEANNVNNPSSGSSGLGLGRTTNIMMNRIQESGNTITKSFGDIKLIKSNAKQLIDIAAQLRAKVLNDNKQSNDINGILQNIGFIDPVTKETSGKEYYTQLSKQIAAFLTDYLSQSIGIISLIDAYCVYNRARGINTISPKDMKIGVDHLKFVTSNIEVKTFGNDMTILHTNDFKMEILMNKLNKFENFMTKNYITVNEFTEITKITNSVLSKSLLDEMLANGFLCIDESDKDLRYYKNLFLM